MAAVTPVASVEALVAAIQKSGLLSTAALDKMRQSATMAQDPKQLARELVKDGTLTKWQAEQLLNGYHRLLIGKYKLLDQLAAAPTGRIYLAEHAQMGRRHALKVLAKRLASNPQAVKHFLGAAQNACGLDHRNISHVYDVNQDHERHSHYVVMEYVEGEDLEKLVERGGPLTPLEALDFILQAAEGLAHAHENGVVHGELRPSNLLRDQTGTIKILEIGQAGTGATFETEGADEAIEMAALASVIFQPPELRGDGEVADVSSDIYSLGSVLCFLLTGSAAPDAATAAALLQSQSDVPAELAELCRRLMADKPADRPPSMIAVVEPLVAIARQLTTPAPKTKPDGNEPRSQPVPSDKHIAPATAPASLPKQPPMAKSLESPASAAVVLAAESQSVGDTDLLGPLAIKVRERPGKHGAAKPVKPVQPAAFKPPANAESSPVLSPKGYGPLVVAGAIGGGGVLVLALLIAVVSLLVVRRGATPVAQSTNSTKPVAGSSDSVALSADTPIDDTSAPHAALKPPVAVLDAEPPPISQSPAAAEASLSAKQPPVDAAAAPAPAAIEVKKAPPPEVKPEPKPEPKSEPAKSAPKATGSKTPTKAEPFKGLAKAVSLPALTEASVQPDSTARAAVLGPCTLEGDTPLVATLLGGETAVRGTKHKFELQAKPDNSREWDFVVSGVGESSSIAKLSANEGELHFAWTDEGMKQSGVAKQLCNCALSLTAGMSHHLLALRTAVMGQPLIVAVEKSGTTAKWNIGDLPAGKQVFVEVTRAEEIKIHKQEPKGAVAAGDPLTVWTGPTEKIVPLGLRLNTTSNARDVTVTLVPQVKLAGSNEPRLFRQKELATLQQKVVNELPVRTNELEAAKRDRPSTIPAKAAIEKPLIEKKKAVLAAEVQVLTAVHDQLNYLVGFSDTYQDSARIHFRVYCQAGDAKIELLRTEDEPPPGKKK